MTMLHHDGGRRSTCVLSQLVLLCSFHQVLGIVAVGPEEPQSITRLSCLCIDHCGQVLAQLKTRSALELKAREADIAEAQAATCHASS